MPKRTRILVTLLLKNECSLSPFPVVSCYALTKQLWKWWNLAALYRVSVFTFSNASYGDCVEVKREYYQNCFIYCQRVTSSMGTVNRNSSYSPVGSWVCLFVFLGCMICLYVLLYVLFYLGQLSHFYSCFGAGVTNLNEPPSSFLAPSPLLRVRRWLHPF